MACEKSFVEVTDAGRGLSHQVPRRLYEDGLRAGTGRYQAGCGQLVLAAAMVTEPGRRCPLCRAAVSARLRG